MSIVRLQSSGPAMVAACLLLQACGEASGPDTTSLGAEQCVEIPDGYYLFTEGKFSPVSGELALEEVPQVTQQRVVWSDDVERRLAELGFEWMSVEAKGPVAILSGTAPDEAAREAGLGAGRSAITADRQASSHVKIVLDGMSVDGGTQGPGASLASLSDTPPPEACQAAYQSAMQGRSIEFANDQSLVPSDQTLMDALTGITLLCHDYRVEIGVHTDARGADSYNQTMSQQRADAVRAYLSDAGVDSDKLVARGFGESQPIDPAQTTEAYARNRRVEFTVLAD